LTYEDNVQPADRRLRAPVQLTRHPMLVPFPVVCFVVALATDIA
jgi:uncharacterized membrane protein